MELTPWWRKRRSLAGARCLPTSQRRIALTHFRVRPSVEALEDRSLLAAHTIAGALGFPLSFQLTGVVTAGNPNPLRLATVSGYLNSSTAVDIYAISLRANDTLTARIDTLTIGSGLDSYLRFFDPNGNPIAANDNANGTDSALKVQVANPGTYYVGVSGFGNSAYNPATTPSSGDSTKAGLYSLNLSTPNTPLAPTTDLEGGLFQVTSGPAKWGDSITFRYQIDNRGATSSGVISAQVFLASNPSFVGGGDVLSRISDNQSAEYQCG